MDLIPREFFDRPSQEVAPDLLGCVLEHETAEGLVAVEITEVEAYAGETDPASHSYRGRTGRNGVMFGPPGYAYVYFTYGMHFCVNVVCMPAGIPRAVLLRAGRVTAGEDLARRRRARWRSEASQGSVLPARDLARGPARLCQALAIDRTQNGADLCDPASPLRLLPGRTAPLPRTPRPGTTGSGNGLGTPRLGYPAGDDAGPAQAEPAISTGPRVGVSAAADVPWRFWVAGDPTVSAYRLHKARVR